MRCLISILQADLKRLWPLSIAVTAIVLFHGWIDIQLVRGFVSFTNARWFRFEPLLLLAAWWCLVGALIQHRRSQEGTNNSISSATTLSAKALFLILFISLPSFLAQSVVLSLSGFSLANYIGAQLWNQACLFVYFLLAASFAAVTRNFVTYFLTSLLVFAAANYLLGKQANSPGGQWMGEQWVAEIAVQLTVLLGSLVVLTLAYHANRMRFARVALAMTVAATILLLCLPWWHAAFAVTAATRPDRDQTTRNVRIAFEPSGGSTQVSTGRPGSVRVALPVRITGIPSGRQLATERISIKLNSSGVGNWRSPWLETSEIAAHTDWRNSDDWLVADGAYWLSFDLPANELDHFRNRPTDLQADVAFSSFTAPVTTKLPSKPQAYSIADSGLCTFEQLPHFTHLSCVNPFGNKVALDFQVKSPGSPSFHQVSFCCEISYSPLLEGGHFSVWELFGSSPSATSLSAGDEVLAEVRHPVSFFERRLVIPQVDWPVLAANRQP